jgi:hypothetical protein
MSHFLRRLRTRRAAFMLATTLALGAGALIGATVAVAGPAVSTSTPMTFGGTNTCTGEAFTGTGTLHFLLSENLSASGSIQFHLNARLDGLKAVTPTGKKYVVQETFNQEFVIGRATEETFAITAHYVRVGEDGSLVLGDDFYQYLRTHITANANGEVTASRVEFEDAPCQ